MWWATAWASTVLVMVSLRIVTIGVLGLAGLLLGGAAGAAEGEAPTVSPATIAFQTRSTAFIEFGQDELDATGSMVLSNRSAVTVLAVWASGKRIEVAAEATDLGTVGQQVVMTLTTTPRDGPGGTLVISTASDQVTVPFTVSRSVGVLGAIKPAVGGLGVMALLLVVLGRVKHVTWSAPVALPAEWKLSESYGANLIAVGAISASVVAASSSVKELYPQLAVGQLAVINVALAGVATLAPLVFAATRTNNGDARLWGLFLAAWLIGGCALAQVLVVGLFLNRAGASDFAVTPALGVAGFVIGWYVWRQVARLVAAPTRGAGPTTALI